MDNVIKHNIHFIHLLHAEDTSRDQKEMLIRTVSKNQLRALSEIAYNTLKGSIELEEVNKRRLKRYAHALRVLGDRRKSISDRREVLSIPLLNILLPAVFHYITTLISQS